MIHPIQPELKEKMNEVGGILKEFFHPYGFVLLAFDYGNKGRMNYLSSACREDVIAAMKEFIAHVEGRHHETPSETQ